MVHSVAYLGFHEGGPKFLLASAYAYAKGGQTRFSHFFLWRKMFFLPGGHGPMSPFEYATGYIRLSIILCSLLDPHYKAVLLYNTDITTDPKMCVITRFPLCTMKDVELDRC